MIYAQVLICELLFDPEEYDAIRTRDRALRLFTFEKDASDEDSSVKTAKEEKPYTVVVKSSQLFWLVVGFFVRGFPIEVLQASLSTFGTSPT